MPQIQYFHDFIFKDDLPIKFRRYHTYLIYHMAAACNMAKDLVKDITYYFKHCLKFDASKLSPDILHYSGHGKWSEAMICYNEASTTSKTTPDRV